MAPADDSESESGGSRHSNPAHCNRSVENGAAASCVSQRSSSSSSNNKSNSAVLLGGGSGGFLWLDSRKKESPILPILPMQRAHNGVSVCGQDGDNIKARISSTHAKETRSDSSADDFSAASAGTSNSLMSDSSAASSSSSSSVCSDRSVASDDFYERDSEEDYYDAGDDADADGADRMMGITPSPWTTSTTSTLLPLTLDSKNQRFPHPMGIGRSPWEEQPTAITPGDSDGNFFFFLPSPTTRERAVAASSTSSSPPKLCQTMSLSEDEEMEVAEEYNHHRVNPDSEQDHVRRNYRDHGELCHEDREDDNKNIGHNMDHGNGDSKSYESNPVEAGETPSTKPQIVGDAVGPMERIMPKSRPIHINLWYGLSPIVEECEELDECDTITNSKHDEISEARRVIMIRDDDWNGVKRGVIHKPSIVNVGDGKDVTSKLHIPNNVGKESTAGIVPDKIMYQRVPTSEHEIKTRLTESQRDSVTSRVLHPNETEFAPYPLEWQAALDCIRALAFFA